jgi:hypothetical protein
VARNLHKGLDDDADRGFDLCDGGEGVDGLIGWKSSRWRRHGHRLMPKVTVGKPFSTLRLKLCHVFFSGEKCFNLSTALI